MIEEVCEADNMSLSKDVARRPCGVLGKIKKVIAESGAKVAREG